MLTLLKKKSVITLFMLLFILLTVNTAFSQAAEVSGKAWYKKTDGNNIIAIHLNIEPGAYLYHTELGDSNALGTPLSISLSPTLFSILDFATSEPKTKTVNSFNKDTEDYKVNVHKDSMNIFLRIDWNKNKLSNIELPEITVHLNGQICNSQRCLQVALALPVQYNSDSDEANQVFAQIPDYRKFRKPLAHWNTTQHNFHSNSQKSPSSVFRFNIANSTDNALNPASANVPSFADIIEQDINNSQSSPVHELPEFNIRSDTHGYSYLVWLLIALAAGVLLNFMPCVLPVVSFKIFGFINQAHEDKRKLILLSICFSGGIVTVFLVLALAAVFFGMQWGEQFQSETFNIVLACLVFAFALSFLGVYEFSAPTFAGKIQTKKSIPHEGYLGTFITGILATLMATPCSGPFLGATVSWALAQNALTVIMVFVCIGIGMALPYFLLSLSSRMRSILPKPGNWMLTFRTIMGFVLLLTVIYLMLFIRSENLLATCTLMIVIAFSCWLYGRYGTVRYSRKIRHLTIISAALITAAGSYGIFNILNPAIQHTQSFSQTSQDVDTLEKQVDKARIRQFDFDSFINDLSTGKNILVDFTADWCPNCQYNTHYVFSDEDVKNKLKDKAVVFYEADLTDDTPKTNEIRKFLESIGGSAIPYAGVFPADNPTSPYVLPDILSTAEVIRTLDKLPNPANMSK